VLKDLFISKTRVKLLIVFLSNPGKIFYVRELVRAVGEQINAVRAELSRMEKVGMLTSEIRANRKFYGFRKDYIYFDELSRMVAKSHGLGGDIIKERGKLGKIKYAVLSGGYVRRRPVGSSDVDLLVVGNVVIPQLAQIVKKAEEEVGREINYTVMAEDEFNFRKRRKDPFIMGILEKTRIMLIGDEEEIIR
jgi:predicted nucleotidyltransferase